MTPYAVSALVGLRDLRGMAWLISRSKVTSVQEL
jgi:hypothetical protein